VDTTALGRVLGEVIVTEEERALPEEVAAALLPHAVKAANAINDSAPNAILTKINISPHSKKTIEQLLAGCFAGRQ
jgi:hypothetical protein